MFDENSNCQTSATTALSAANGSMAMVNHLMNVKDSRWLQLEVCREFQRGQCSRTENECKFAHPPPHVDVQNGRVTACYDSIKVRFMLVSVSSSLLISIHSHNTHLLEVSIHRPQSTRPTREPRSPRALPKIAIVYRGDESNRIKAGPRSLRTRAYTHIVRRQQWGVGEGGGSGGGGGGGGDVF